MIFEVMQVKAAMASWNELNLACNLRVDVPQQVIDILNYLIAPKYDLTKGEYEPIPTPEHHFFNSYYRWQTLLVNDTYYFPGDPHSSLKKNALNNFYKFTARAMVRRGDIPVAAFLHWLAPFCETEGFVGYTRCDEIPDVIDLIYFETGEVYYQEVVFYTQPPTIRRVKITEKGPYDTE